MMDPRVSHILSLSKIKKKSLKHQNDLVHIRSIHKGPISIPTKMSKQASFGNVEDIPGSILLFGSAPKVNGAYSGPGQFLHPRFMKILSVVFM